MKEKTKLAQLSATPSMISSLVAIQSKKAEEPAAKQPKLTLDSKSSFSSIGSQPKTPLPLAAT